ncbi:MAG: DNA recombination protein RmuC [Pseudomonadota bacterium]|nr:DNA recombination protein RmuC [Pseudomonadota bacterium]
MLNDFNLLSVTVAYTVLFTSLAIAYYLFYRQLKSYQNSSQQQQNDILQHLQEQQNDILQHLQHQQTLSNLMQKSLDDRFDRLQSSLYTLSKDQLSSQQQELRSSMNDIRQQLQATLSQQTHSVNQHIQNLQQKVDQHLSHISGQVDKRLTDGFAKTQNIFTDVIKRLALIDQAQQKITDLSSNVVSLQDILSNKQARGHFGEVQLHQLVKNCIPQGHYAMQYSLSNAKRADCVLFLPEPTGTIAIDAKFPLENYRALINHTDLSLQQKSRQLFRHDLKEHIKAVGDKYIVTDETANAAMLFLPAESIFAEIHAHHPDLVEFAFSRKVWLASPTTMMAILHTAQAVLRDIQTQEQVHTIQKHLRHLSEDFSRFSSRMQYVAKHIHDAQDKVTQVKISADKIAKRFDQIQQVKLKEHEGDSLLT